ncbi:hypothetical protein [Micromonospora sp. NBRC 101691]|uniref:hypothetical protein n=1 Tax=Micromonospora sp. NBRC 101691 TaxID=3032198 RepID=UPI0024A0B0BC|nr:hypothetical protein [Micromonospora sp. NBRC 101691]GLY24279.1 hypothetical protein Misp04_40110 [Micromonospora sp. NBRC 101691]
MTGRVFVDDIGVSVVHSAGTTQCPWPEMGDVTVQASLLPPHDQRLVELDISHVSGEFMTVTDQFEGFHEAVAAVAARSGARLPDLATLGPSDGVVHLYP